MRIGHVLAHYPAPGGTSAMVAGLSRGLSAVGHDVIVYRADVPDGARVGESTTLVRTLPGGEPRLPWGRTGHTTTFRTDGLDVVVVHGMFNAFAAQAAHACHSQGIPYIVCPHDPYAPELFRTDRLRKSAYWRLVEAPMLRGAVAVHTLAPSHATFLERRRVTTPAFAIPNGIDEYRRQPAPTPRPANERPILLYVGRWDIHNKGIDLLLRALRTAEPHWRLWLAGPSSEAEGTRVAGLVAEMHLTERVSLLGYVDDIDETIRCADLVVLPSRFDGFGLVVLEALVRGIPVLASTRVGATEYLGADDGIVAVEADVESIARGLTAAHAKRAELRAAAIDGRQRLARAFSWEAVAMRWSQAVESLVR